MINEIYVNDELIVDDKPRKKFKNGYVIRCNECDELIERKSFDNTILTKKYVCKKCVLTNHNPMFDLKIRQKHAEICKTDEYRKNVSNSITGNKNGFYGKKHTKETKDKIKNGFKLWLNNLTENEYIEWTHKMSVGNQKLMEERPEFYSEMKAKAARESHKSQFKNVKMNKIEKKVNTFLQTMNNNFKYSIILGGYQYDFGDKDLRILIEVNGDYWHGNPKYYNLDGSDDKRKLNEIQKNKINKDIEKIKWAKEHNFTVITIWEHEINDDKYKNKLIYEISRNKNN